MGVTSLFEILSILRYVRLDPETYDEIQDSLSNNLAQEFKLLSKCQKFYIFLKEFIEISNDKSKNSIFKIILENLAFVTDLDFLESIDFLDAKNEVDMSEVWKCKIGHNLLDNYVLKNFDDVVLDFFLVSKPEYSDFLKKFIEKLISKSDDLKKEKIVKKLKDLDLQDKFMKFSLNN